MVEGGGVGEGGEGGEGGFLGGEAGDGGEIGFEVGMEGAFRAAPFDDVFGSGGGGCKIFFEI